jgi:hypothetical protein
MPDLIEDEYNTARDEFAATLAAALKIDAAVVTDALVSGVVADSLEDFHVAWLQFDDLREFADADVEDDEDEDDGEDE